MVVGTVTFMDRFTNFYCDASSFGLGYIMIDQYYKNHRYNQPRVLRVMVVVIVAVIVMGLLDSFICFILSRA
jgi:uncharacterized membrane protein YwzB